MDAGQVSQVGFLNGPQIEIVAEAVGGGVECPLVRASDGRIYSLMGLPKDVEIDDKIKIVGTIKNISFCMQGQTIQVETVVVLQRSGSGRLAATR